MRNYLLALTCVFALSFSSTAQNKENAGPTLISTSSPMIEVPAISTMTDIPVSDGKIVAQERRTSSNYVVPGKGLPIGPDPLAIQQKNTTTYNRNPPLLTFDANTSGALQDPTGAIGPDHYVMAFNSGFRIYDTEGNALSGSMSLATIWPGESLGDPIVVYDRYAERFIIMQFSASPNGILVAACQGSDPVNDGWYTYRFNTGSFPDYEKLSIWSDGYYITANKDQGSPGTSEVVYALDREAILAGAATADFVGFPLPGLVNNPGVSFYSPAGFNCIGPDLPPSGDVPIVYFQDDAWPGISSDHLKMWKIDMDWDNTTNSTISSAEIIPTAPFDAVFDGGSFSNLEQPNGSEIDALQALLNYMTNYRRFPTHNSAIMNWVIDLDGNDGVAGLRWMELRQTADGMPWEVYQEGTYVQPDGLNAWCGSMCMDSQGNIGMGYSVVSPDVFPSLRYTGRYANDPLGVMTVAEEVVGDGTTNAPSTRYGDYSQTTIDPVDDKTFWYIGEYFIQGGQRTSRVGTFKLAPNFATDVGIISIDSPTDGILGTDESITVTVRNFGENEQSNIPISIQIDGGAVISEVYPGPLAGSQNAQYTFTETGDFSSIGTTYNIDAVTTLGGDQDNLNNGISGQVTHLEPDDLGVIAVVTPVSADGLTVTEEVTVTVQNFGGADQTGFDVGYSVNGGSGIVESYVGTLPATESDNFTFVTTADLSALGSYEILAYTSLAGDIDTSNDAFSTTVDNQLCQPGANCNLGDGVEIFVLGDINNNSGCDDNGYGDYTNLSTDLLAGAVADMTVTTGYGNQYVKVWIDFNDNSIFSIDEVLVNDIIIAPGSAGGTFTETIDLDVPEDATLGEHLLRIKTNWNTGVPSDPCASTTFGETEDYTVNILPVGIEENYLGENELIVATLDDKKFLITFTTDRINEPLIFNVHNALGQTVTQNWINPLNGVYTYELDMSYARAGSYLIRLGNERGGKVKRIIVE